jgi:hypothetical protein
MKKLIYAGIGALVLLALATPSFAAEKGKGKERTIKGEAMCAKCVLKEPDADKCQTVIQVENKKGKKINYYLADNDVAKDFHENVCKAAKKVVATGTVKKLDNGKLELTVTKIELAKDK